METIHVLLWLWLCVMPSKLEYVTIVMKNPLQLPCCSDSATHATWAFKGVDSQARYLTPITNFDRGINKYISTSRNGCAELIFNPVEMADAGVYECKLQERRGTGSGKELTEKIQRVQLIVFGSVPSCSSNKGSYQEGPFMVEANSPIHFWCSIEYRGFINPVINWRRNGNKIGMPEGHATVSRVNDNVKSSLTYRVTSDSTVSDFVCVIALNDTFNESPATTGNIQSNYQCQLPRIELGFAPHRITIQTNKTVFTSGEYLTCAADANPPADFHWRAIDKGSNQSGARLDFDESFGCVENCSYECIATNEFGSERKSISFSLIILAVSKPQIEQQNQQQQAEQFDAKWIGTVCVLGILLVGTALGFTVYIVVLKNRREDYERPVPVEDTKTTGYTEIEISTKELTDDYIQAEGNFYDSVELKAMK